MLLLLSTQRGCHLQKALPLDIKKLIVLKRRPEVDRFLSRLVLMTRYDGIEKRGER